MSRENVELVRTVFAPFEGINVATIDWSTDSFRELFAVRFSPDVELTTLASGLGSGVGEHYSGWDGLIRYLTEWIEPFSEYQVENLDYIDAGDFVLIPSRQWGIGAGSGVKAEIELTTLYEVRDGRITRIHQFDTLDEARAAAAKPG
jgi:ketosteroid isomerase-like protein